MHSMGAQLMQHGAVVTQLLQQQPCIPCGSKGVVLWCVLQLFRAPRGRIQPLSQMGQDLQAHDRKWLEGLPRKQGTRSLGTITETRSFHNGIRTRNL